jgi:hypothetical protein
MAPAERLGIRIGGEAVAEVDVAAAHLSIMRGLLRLPIPAGDPYEITGATRCRPAVKAWILATLGKGSPVKRKPRLSMAGLFAC